MAQGFLRFLLDNILSSQEFVELLTHLDVERFGLAEGNGRMMIFAKKLANSKHGLHRIAVVTQEYEKETERIFFSCDEDYSELEVYITTAYVQYEDEKEPNAEFSLVYF